MKVLNTSPQIINADYNSETNIMTIITPEDKYIFRWDLGKPYDDKKCYE